MSRTIFTMKAAMLILIFTFQLSKAFTLTGKDNLNPIQAKIIQQVKPLPILDTISEHEKCCNTQQHLIGKKILVGVEALTRVGANLIPAPQKSANALGAGITRYLNQIGSKLVGLDTRK